MIQPLHLLISAQSEELNELEDKENELRSSLRYKEKSVQKVQAQYQKAASEFNEASTLLLRMKNFVKID